VLAAAAALCGLRADGSLMPGSTFPEGSVSVQAIADELGLYRGAASRGVEHCVRTGALVRMPDGTVRPAPEVHATRWAQDRQRVRLDRTDRERGLRGPVLLLLGLIRGQLDPRGQLRLGVTLLAERTGLQPRVVERHLAALRRIGAIHTWLVPGKWQLVVAMGPCRETSEEERAREAVADGCRETSVPDVANRRSRCRESSVPMSRSVGRDPESGVPDQPPEARASARTVEPETRAAEPEPESGNRAEPTPTAPPAVAEVQGIVEQWLLRVVARGIEVLQPENPDHVSAVADLIGRLPGANPPDAAGDPRRLAALARERLELARRVCRWARSSERVARWLIRVRRWFGVESRLGAYLRAAAEKGDPGCLLEGGTVARVGRGAETWRDFTPATEQQLEGEHAADVQKLVAGGVAVVAERDPRKRARLRLELRALLERGDRDGARRVLWRLLGSDRSDVALARATEDICPLAEAKELLAA